MTQCITCKGQTESTTVGHLGTTTGVLCEDCTIWCDGNRGPADAVIPPAQFVGIDADGLATYVGVTL